MRIALISTSFLPSVGGVEWKMHYLATEYQHRGHEVMVFSARDRWELGVMPVEPTYPVVRSGWPIAGLGRLGVNQWAIRQAVLSSHRERAFDILHCHHLGVPTQIAAQIRMKAGVPVVATTCGGDVQVCPEIGYGDRLQPRFDRLARWNVRHVDVIGSISRSVRAALEEMGTTARIVDIPNGVPWEQFQTGPSVLLRTRLGLGADKVIVLSVGRNHRVKGFDDAVRAFAKVAGRFPQAHYVFVGRWMEPLKELGRELGIADRLSFVDQVPMSEVPLMLRSADIFMSTSRMEGFSQVNVQAMACGVPCVLTDAPGNRDAADHGGALLARTGDPEAIAEALGRLLGDDGLRRRLAEEAHAASVRYDWARIAEQYLGVFEEILAVRGMSAKAVPNGVQVR